MEKLNSDPKASTRRSKLKVLLIFFTGFAFAILCFLLIDVAMEPASRSEFCGSTCHEMSEAYRSWELSPHGANNSGFRVECIDCHLPSKEHHYFSHIFSKAYEGGKDVFIHLFIGNYDTEKSRAKARKHMPNERCTNCHDTLLTKPGSSAARIAHIDMLNATDGSKQKCIECHEDVAHQRQNKLYSP